MSKKKKDKLLLNLLEGEKYKHRVAMVTDEGAFNQHEPNSNMARMFVVMLLIHVVVIGGIIIYDFMNGEEAPATAMAESYNANHAKVVPQASLDLGLGKGHSLEESSTYAWLSGDSIPSVAKKLEVSEEVLIKLNKLDEGRQLKINDVILYPKRPVVKAVGISVARADGSLPQPAIPEASIAAAEVPINLALPGETAFSFSPTIENELTPMPAVGPGEKIQDSPPVAVTKEASGMPAIVELPVVAAQPKVEDAPPAPVTVPKPVVAQEVEKVVPKAVPVPRPEPKAAPVEKAPVKKIVDTPPPAKKEPAKSGGSTHVVQSGENFYRIATKYGISVGALQAANKSAKPESLQIGAKLTIPHK